MAVFCCEAARQGNCGLGDGWQLLLTYLPGGKTCRTWYSTHHPSVLIVHKHDAQRNVQHQNNPTLATLYWCAKNDHLAKVFWWTNAKQQLFITLCCQNLWELCINTIICSSVLCPFMWQRSPKGASARISPPCRSSKGNGAGNVF